MTSFLEHHLICAVRELSEHQDISMQIVMIGAGYVGLTTGTCLAEAGHNVSCYDIDRTRIARLARGEIPIYEPQLEASVRQGIGNGRLRFTNQLDDCVGEADAVFLAVGTPSRANGDIDLSQVNTAARQIATRLRSGAVVVVKSTVVVGTCRRVQEIIARQRQASDISVASNPEFLREGAAMHDCTNPDRIIVGADEPRADAILKKLFAPFTQQGVPLISTTTANAELIKYAANAFLALKVGFINEVADLCESAGGDVAIVAKGMGLDRRIGTSFLAPGPGYGGSCFPKDTRAFAATGRRLGASQRLIETLIERNEQRKTKLARRVIDEAGLVRGSTAAVLGLAFKADTDDVRESAALRIIDALQEAGITVRAHDPQAMKNARAVLSDVQFAESPYEAARGADAVVVLTEWDAYRTLNLGRLANAMRGATLFDYRNLFAPGDVARYGLRHVSLGRSAPAPSTSTAGAGAPTSSPWSRRVAANRPV